MEFSSPPAQSIKTSASLLDPIGVDAFIGRYLEREVLHIERRDPSLVEGIFDLDSIGQCLQYMQPQSSGRVRVVGPDGEGERSAELRGTIQSMSDHGIASLRAQFTNRHTLIFTGAEDYWPPVERIVMDLRRVLRSNVRCNVYCTPPASQGFDTHVDGHDVLVLQTSGSKTWRIHETQTSLPLESSPILTEMLPRLSSAAPDYGEPNREVVLHPGDVLYLPRGVPHSAASTDEHSVHLTIGLYPMRMHEFVGQVVDLVANESVELRRRVPIEFHSKTGADIPSAGDLLRQVAAMADAVEPPIDLRQLAQITEDAYAPPASPTGSFSSALASKTIDLETVLERPTGVAWRTRRGPSELRVSCGRTISLPLKLEPILGFFEQHPRFRVRDMPSILTDDAKMTLARTLLTEDLLRVSDQPAPELATGSEVRSAGPDLSWLQPNLPAM